MQRFQRIAEWTSKRATWAKWIGYPLFYLLCLAIFGYLSFPFDQLKGRIIAEFERMQEKQQRRPGEPLMRLEIDELDGYWLSGLEVTGARLIIPRKPKAKSSPRGLGFGGGGDEDDEAPKGPNELVIDHATARVQLLPLLAGDVVVNFDAEAFGGTLEGSVPVGAEAGGVKVGFDAVQLAKITPLADLLQGVPVSGLASGEVQLSPKEGKFSKADGEVAIQIENAKLGSEQKNEETGEMEDVVEIQGIRIPAVQVGAVAIEGTAVNGLLTLDQFGARGRDFELIGKGKIKLGETWETSQADVTLKFKFTDPYRTASAAATSLLGKPGDKVPPLIEAGPSPLRRAKTDDGYYRFQLQGPLGKAEPRPAGTSGSKRPSRRSPGARGRGGRATPSPGRTPRLNKPRPTPRKPVRRRPEPEDEREDEREERASPRVEREPERPPREPEPEEEDEEDEELEEGDDVDEELEPEADERE